MGEGELHDEGILEHAGGHVGTWHAYLPGYAWRERLDQICRDTHPGSKWNFIGGRTQDGVVAPADGNFSAGLRQDAGHLLAETTKIQNGPELGWLDRLREQMDHLTGVCQPDNHLVIVSHGGDLFSVGRDRHSAGVTRCRNRPRALPRVQVVELASAISIHEIRRLLGNSWRADQVQFRHSAPDNPRPLYQVFGDKLRFNQDVNALRVGKADCERPIAVSPDRPTIAAQYETSADRKLNIPFLLEVDRAIRLLLNREEASVDRVADSLGISPRTLQHRLKQSDTSYQSLFDIARIDLALEYLNDSDLNVLAISERVGFTDAAAFSRFFKKHLKLSPRDYSKRIR